MNKQMRWLHNEISSWQSEQIISTQQAEQLRARYVIDDKARAWDRLIFPAIGAVVLGFGVILFFAYNWSGMHKYLKLAIVFSGLLATHSLGYYFTSPQRIQKGFGEGLFVLGTMLFGVGIWLIAQIYHLDEHYPNAILVWSLGALAFAWALPSVAQGLIAVALLSMWSGVEILDFRHDYHAGWLFILIGLLPLAWILRSRVLLLFSLVACSVLFTYNLVTTHSDLAIYAPFYLACLYIALARLVQSTGFPESRSILRGIGFLGYLLFLYVFSFDLHNRFSVEYDDMRWFQWAYCLIPIVLALITWSIVLFRNHCSQTGRLQRLESILIAFVMFIVGVNLTVPIQYQLDWLYTLLFNLVYLSHCVIVIILGIQQVSWKQVSFGCALMALLLLVRFNDLFDSLLVRSLMFVLLGLGLFIIGYFYSRHKQELDNA
jgi:uncharacterized membrane protein